MTVTRRHRWLALLGLSIATPVAAQRPAPAEPGVIRVCADPDNLPSSNSAGEGYENKLAEMLAQAWNSKLVYVWWAAPRGLVSRALNGQYCDVIMEAPSLVGYDMAGVTRPYYRSSYVIAQRADAPHRVMDLDDPVLKTMKIGVHLYAADAENSPPAMVLSHHGVVGNLQGFGTAFVGGRDHPQDIIQAVVDGKVDVAMVWGPIAGYFGKQLGANLTLTPIADDSALQTPMAYNIGFAVRRRDRALKDSLEKFISTRGSDIRAVLETFGIPMLPLAADPSTGSADGPPSR
jgi:quinoprotein dehydrogenase-associated probable ABC transporter substrate-binding protein